MKRTDRISPVVWAIGIIVIAVTIFLAWLGRHSQRVHSQPEPAPTISTAPSATRSITAGPAQNSPSTNIQTIVTEGGLLLQNSQVQVRYVLEDGAVARGVVIDENDKPIAGATVWAGQKYLRGRQETNTDSQGRFDFKYVTKGNVSFTASAQGYESAKKTVAINSTTRDIIFKLNTGRAIHGVVQDESGSPILDVRVTLDSTFERQNYDTYDFVTLTDVEGKFSWDSAPAQPLYYNFVKVGYEQKHSVLLTPGDDNVITLRAPRRLEGLVLDANSGQPIPQFSIRTGHYTRPDSISGTIRDQEFNHLDGRFNIPLDDENDDAVQVWSDDHSLKTESFPAAENGVIQITIRLDPVDALKGIVTTEDGTPVVGANVLATSSESGSMIQLKGSHFQSYDARTQVALTDQQGVFLVKTPPQHGTVMAIAKAGFASASVDEVRASHLIVIQAFGRIEGTVKIGGIPAAGQSLIYTPPDSKLTSDFQTYKTTTDEAGHFTMEQIPPGEGSIARLISTSPNSWTYSHYTAVTVRSGQTTEVTLGDSGATLRGTVRFQSPPTNDEPLIISGRFFSGFPQPPHFSSSAEQQAYLNSPEWQAKIKRPKSFFFVVNADGGFQVDSVEPGPYTIDVSARPAGDNSFMDPALAQGILPFTVPDNANPMNPIFVGEIVLEPTPSR